MFFVLTQFISSAYVELTSKNIDNIIGGNRPAFIKFYSTKCPHCEAMAEDFAEAATAFTEVTFGGLNCIEETELCEKYKIDGYPTIMFYKAKETTGVEYEGKRKSEDFCKFVENQTNIKAKLPPNNLIDLNPSNFNTTVSNHKCVLNTFFAPWCGHCKHFLPQAKIAANAFQADPQIVISRLNCDEYNDFCEKNDIPGFPTIRLFKDGEFEKYTGKRTAEAVVNFINDKCGTERAVNGLLNDKAGLIEEAAPIVTEFLSSTEKEPIVEKMKAIKGAEFYVKVMERYIAKGQEQIEKDIETMNNLLEARKGSFASLDGMKKRLNVFQQFVPKEVEEEPAKEEKEEEKTEL
ncbi:Thioredoxin family protein [Histomonas meleagridis]|uniref:Thioredoxin family protein n=1 Tax=Histomonas meleagridis TaxID=135588 RepID=UPI00355A59F4|nr:Thioredoxin family protein [Histomonas meleagridis]KAH0797770.1 Thioredoxin family protein [Histomonas meleagridis]